MPRALRIATCMTLMMVSPAILHSQTSERDRGHAGSNLYVNYSSKPDAQEVLKHDLCILDPDADIDLTPGHRLGHQYLAYVSTVEIIPGGKSMTAARARGVSLIAKNPDWQTEVMDITSPAWMDFIIEDLAASAIAKGYDGFFLDTLDSVELITVKAPAKEKSTRAALVSLITQLRKRFPEKRIILNRGFSVVQETAPKIDGVLIEGLYQTWDLQRKVYISTAPGGTSWLLDHIQKIKKLALPVYVLDYVDPQDTALARRTSQRIRTAGGIPFISTPDLQGMVLGRSTTSTNPGTDRTHAKH